VPEGVTIVGVDCGTRHKLADEKYIQARTTALIARAIIRHLMPSTGDNGGQWDGYLARISVTDYVDRLRDRLPTKLKGALFLERFGEVGDELAQIDPTAVYKVRSRAEHHIYEDDRVRQFAERLARVSRTGERRALLEAGELMYASHWSYGQRCGLGSIETDLLMNLLRAEGPQHGIFGARISGPGAGGTVVVLMNDAADAYAAVDRAVAAYQERTKHVATLRPIAQEGSAGLAVEQCA
jgi:L-arabinokinase